MYGRKFISGSWILGRILVLLGGEFWFGCCCCCVFLLFVWGCCVSFCHSLRFCGVFLGVLWFLWVLGVFCLYRAFWVLYFQVFFWANFQGSWILWLIVCALCVFFFVCVSWFFFRGGRERDKELWLWRLRRRMSFWEERGRRYWFWSSSCSRSDGRKKIGLERGRSSCAEHTYKGSWRFVVI